MKRLPLTKEALVESLNSTTKEISELSSVHEKRAKELAQNLRTIANQLEYANEFGK